MPQQGHNTLFLKAWELTQGPHPLLGTQHLQPNLSLLQGPLCPSGGPLSHLYLAKS